MTSCAQSASRKIISAKLLNPMKHKANQFELPGANDVFSLAGEVCKVAEPVPELRADNTPDMFADHAQIEAGRKEYSMSLS